MFIDIGAVGAESDAGVFTQSRLSALLETNEANLPVRPPWNLWHKIPKVAPPHALLSSWRRRLCPETIVNEAVAMPWSHP